MTSEIPLSAFPFLRLPAEIRIYIYQKLLSTWTTSTRASDGEDHGWPVKFSPAILRANKQVFAEASQVLYTKNDFVVLTVTTHREGYSPRTAYAILDDFPNLAGLSEKQILRPALKIAITELDTSPEWIQLPVKKRTFIFTVEGFPDFVHLLWEMSTLGAFCTSMAFKLTLDNKVQSRNAFLNNHVVRSLDQLQGFAQFAISGDVDDEVVQHVTEYMTLGPQLQDVLFRIVGLYSHGERYFKKNDYTLAKRYWDRLRSLWAYRSRFHSLPTRYSPKDFMEATLPIVLKVELAKRMIDLHLKEYKYLVYSIQASFSMAEYVIGEHSLYYHLPHVLQAKLWICQSVGQFALGTSGSKERSRESHDTAVVALCRDPRFAGKSLEVSRELEWARDGYLGQNDDLLECGEEDGDTSAVGTHARRRSFGDWMDLSE
jgi:hypothetical protein